MGARDFVAVVAEVFGYFFGGVLVEEADWAFGYGAGLGCDEGWGGGCGVFCGYGVLSGSVGENLFL